MKVTIDLERAQAEVLLRFLRRVDTRSIEYVLNSAGEEVVTYAQASERLRVAIGKVLGLYGEGGCDDR